MKNVTCWDIETVNWTEIVAIGFYNQKESGVVYNVENIIDKMESIGGEWFAHAAGLFDNKFLLDELFSRYLPEQINIKLIQNKPGHIVIYSDKSKSDKLFALRDSFYLLPLSLRKLAMGLNLSEQKFDIDRSKIETYSKEVIESYVLSDARILYHVLAKIEGLGELDINKLTLAQNAFQNWKYRFVTKGNFDTIKIPAFYDARFREYFYGGRVEVFKRKGYGLNYYDINSMYPHCMKFGRYPVGKPLYSKTEVKGKLGVYRAIVNVPDNVKIPPCPIRDSENGKLVYPVGTFEVNLPIDEIKLVTKVGGGYEIIEGYYWEYAGNYFGDYVDYYFKQKNKNKGKPLYLVSKLFLNSLYGKLAQRRDFREITLTPPKSIDELIDKEYEIIWSKSGDLEIDLSGDLVIDPNDTNLFSFKSESKSKITLLHLGLHVTSYARVLLFNLMHEVISQGGEIYYCDTDSLITDIKVDTSKALGKLDLENKGNGRIKVGYFISPKLYYLKYESGLTIIKGKGIDSSLLKESDFENLLKGKSIESYSTGLQGFLESIRRHSGFVAVREMTKIISGKMDKRRIMKNNIDTKPIKL